MTDTTPVPVAGRQLRKPALVGRLAVASGALLAAGALILGLGLLVAMVVLPATGTGSYDSTSGPGWGRVLGHLAVGAGGELAGQLARRRSDPVRITVGAVTVVAVLAVLALSWWR